MKAFTPVADLVLASNSFNLSAALVLKYVPCAVHLLAQSPVVVGKLGTGPLEFILTYASAYIDIINDLTRNSRHRRHFASLNLTDFLTLLILRRRVNTFHRLTRTAPLIAIDRVRVYP